MEAQIYPLAINLDDQDVMFNRDFFYNTPSSLTDWIHVTIARSLVSACSRSPPSDPGITLNWRWMTSKDWQLRISPLTDHTARCKLTYDTKALDRQMT